MGVFDLRRSQPQRRGATLVCGIACLLMCACTDGKGSPIVKIDSDGGNALEGSTGGRSAVADASTLDEDDDEATQTAECKRIDGMWPSGYANEEKKLFDRVNQIRTNPTPLCPGTRAVAALEWRPALQCAARLHAMEDMGPKGPNVGATVTFVAPDPRGDTIFRDREKRSDSKIAGEIVFSSVNSVQGAIDSLEDDPANLDYFCWFAGSPFLSMGGAGRYGNVWVLDFGYAAGPTRPTTAGMGNSGSGNSGTGGR